MDNFIFKANDSEFVLGRNRIGDPARGSSLKAPKSLKLEIFKFTTGYIENLLATQTASYTKDASFTERFYAHNRREWCIEDPLCT